MIKSTQFFFLNIIFLLSLILNLLGTVSRKGKNAGNIYNAASISAPTICPETGGEMKIGGPFWGAELHDKNVIQR